MLFEALTGAKPFRAENTLAVMYMHLTNEPPKPSVARPGVPSAFDRVIAQGMAKDPARRFASAGELAAAARHALTDRGTKQLPVVPAATPPAPVAAPTPRRRRGPLVAVAAVVVAALLGTGAYIWSQSSSARQTGPTTPTSSAGTSSAAPPSAELGLAKPLTKPACDGSYIVIVGSAVNPAAYATEVQKFLDLNPGANYLHAPSTGCTSLRARLNNADIYSVFYGPYQDKNAACGQQSSVGGDSFVRRLDKSSTPDKTVGCH